jgi:hypothetical protein
MTDDGKIGIGFRVHRSRVREKKKIAAVGREMTMRAGEANS